MSKMASFTKMDGRLILYYLLTRTQNPRRRWRRYLQLRTGHQGTPTQGSSHDRRPTGWLRRFLAEGAWGRRCMSLTPCRLHRPVAATEEVWPGRPEPRGRQVRAASSAAGDASSDSGSNSKASPGVELSMS